LGVVDIHIPVMVREVVEHLRCGPGRFFLDGTVGTGGHGEAILKASEPDGRLIGLDRDGQALAMARERLRGFGSRVVLLQEDYRLMGAVIKAQGIHRLDGILLDLGVSSLQLSDPRRGFSFQSDGPLDMRMDTRSGPTAADRIHRVREKELADILYRYGEERWARRIARAIVRERAIAPIETTLRLAEIVIKAVPPSSRSRSIHPATRTFQALRIWVNRELEGLDDALRTAVEWLRPEGRLCVISFHSLEDRIVKQVFREMGTGDSASIRLITRKPLRPASDEVACNPRARSAKLRVAERIAA
jgi:16S rRNA (cytosine1402-N4)-methyltransferase